MKRAGTGSRLSNHKVEDVWKSMKDAVNVLPFVFSDMILRTTLRDYYVRYHRDCLAWYATVCRIASLPRMRW